MKKLLALTLSLLMVFSCMTCLFTGTASAETTAPEDITWQTPATDSWASIVPGEGTVYENGPVWHAKTQFRAIYTRISLEPNTTYNYTMYTKGIVLEGSYNQFSIVSSLGSDALDFAKLSSGWSDYKPASHLADGAVVAYNSYYKDLGATDVTGADGATWNKISINFTTSDATQYIIVLNSIPPTDQENPAMYISDLSIEKKILGDWAPARSITISTTEDDGTAIKPYQNGPAYKMTTSPCNQSIYTTATLEANSTYTFTAYFKGYYIPAVGYNYGGDATDGKGETWVISTKAGFDDCHMNNGSVVSTGWFEYYDDDGYENLYKHNAYRDAYTDLDTWRKYSFTFTTGADTKYYIVLGMEPTTGDMGNVPFYMSDVVVEKVIGVSATADGNGTAKVDKAIASSGETVTFTAATAGGSTFLGWYNGDTKVSDNLVYTTVVTDDISLTAKFEGGATAVDGWYSPRGGIGWITTTTDIASVAGGTVYKTGTWPVDRSIYTKVTLKPDTTYTFSAYFMGPAAAVVGNDSAGLYGNAKGDETWIISAKADITKGSAGSSTGISDWNEFTGNGTYANLNKGDGSIDAWDADNKFTTWRKYEITFTTQEDTEYYIILGLTGDSGEQNNYPTYMSDASLTYTCSVSATADGNGTAKVDKATASSGETVTFTAATAGGSTFLGWYNGDTKVSDNLVYTTVVTDDISLTAKFEGGATAVDGWVCPRDTNGWIQTTTDIAPKAGGTVYTTGNWPVDRSIYTKVTLKPGTTYTFSAYFMGPAAAVVGNDSAGLYGNAKGDETWIISAKADITKGSAGSSTGISDWNEFTGNGTYANLNKGDGSIDAWDADNKFTTWRKYEITFTTEEDTEYYIILGLTGDSGEQNNYPTYMSDASIIEVGDATPDVTEFAENLGSSLRKESESTYGQAIRHKFTLEKDVLTANYDGYKVVEIGFATALTEALEGHASIPVLNASSYKVLTGVAYQASYDGTVSKNIVFEENDTTVTYTAALYNISDYAKSYTVVPYVVFANADGNKVTRYGEGQVACIFDVAKAILTGNNEDDKAYVNNTLLAGDYKDQYDAWDKN